MKRNIKLMKKYIIGLLVTRIFAGGAIAQPGYQKVTILLQNYEKNSNLSKNGSFSGSNEQEFKSLFTSQNVMVSSLGLDGDEKSEIPLYKYIALVKSNLDEESDISVVLTKIKIKNPSKISDSKYLYTVSALQSLTAFKKDGSDFTSLKKLNYEIEYTSTSNTAKINSIKITEGSTGLYLDVHVAAGMTSIKGDLISGSTGTLETKSKFGIGFGINLDYMITEKFGITTGITSMTYASSYTLSAYDQQPYRTVDQDNDEYDLMASGTNLENDVKLNYLEIPIGVVMKFGGFMTRLGVKYGIPGSSSSSFSGGSVTTTGYYPKYNATLYDIPEYGFDTYDLSGAEGTIDHKSAFSGFVQLGYSADISPKFGITFMGFYETSFSSVHDSSEAAFATGNNEYTSALSFIDSPKTAAYGLEVGLRFKLF